MKRFNRLPYATKQHMTSFITPVYFAGSGVSIGLFQGVRAGKRRVVFELLAACFDRKGQTDREGYITPKIRCPDILAVVGAFLRHLLYSSDTPHDPTFAKSFCTGLSGAALQCSAFVAISGTVGSPDTVRTVTADR